MSLCCFVFFQAEDGIRDLTVTGVQTCALPIFRHGDLREIARLTAADFTSAETSQIHYALSGVPLEVGIALVAPTANDIEVSPLGALEDDRFHVDGCDDV